jgi:deoxyribodipyrimidine photolyase-related protein
MSNYCKGCRYSPKQRGGPQACPFNVLYWDFLHRHGDELRRNPRMALVIKQLDKLPPEELARVRATAQTIRLGDGAGPASDALEPAS